METEQVAGGGSPGDADVLELKDVASMQPTHLRDFLVSSKETGGSDIIITLCPTHCWGAFTLPTEFSSGPSAIQAL